jgi:predicted RNA-binding protein with PIN domain
VIRNRESARKQLEQDVELYCRTGEIEVTIVYDSKRFPNAFADFIDVQQPVIVFTSIAQEADDYIIEAAEEIASAGTTIVSNDSKVRAGASQAGCATMSAQKFIQLVRKKSAGRPGKRPEKYRKGSLSRDEVDEWLNLFGQNDSDDE